MQNLPEESKLKNPVPSACEPAQQSLFPVHRKPVTLTFSEDKISSDGGLLLLREVENQLGLIKNLTAVLTDERDQRYVDHSYEEILRQRIFQIASGYEDANDCNSLRDDPVLKMCAGRLPENGASLASQPTMTRFENSVSRSDLYRIAKVFADHFLNSYSQEPPVIIIDCDDTNNNTHGDQQLALFNQYYKEYCFMPLHIYEGLSGKLITTLLKPGRRAKGVNIFSILRRLIQYIRSHWKKTLIVVRGDSHFASKDLMDWANQQDQVSFLTGMGTNSKLKEQVKSHIQTARELYQQKKQKIKLYHSFTYQAETWAHPQRVIAKIEYTAMGLNLRFVVTDLREFRAQSLYEKGYCGRGRMELNIKDHKTYLKSDRSSCNKFEANQFRLFLHSAAYVLIHTLKSEVLKGTDLAMATMNTIQLKLFKVAVKVKEMKTRIKLEFPAATAQKDKLITAFGIFEHIRT